VIVKVTDMSFGPSTHVSLEGSESNKHKACDKHFVKANSASIPLFTGISFHFPFQSDEGTQRVAESSVVKLLASVFPTNGV
jgi:hypothetical protein